MSRSNLPYQVFLCRWFFHLVAVVRLCSQEEQGVDVIFKGAGGQMQKFSTVQNT